MEKQKIYDKYYQMLCKLEALCPKSKEHEYLQIKEIIKSYNEVRENPEKEQVKSAILKSAK